jgi:hypothetical protein
MSTGGAAINATIKQIVAASNVGIIKLPNHPTYNLLSVDVIQLQNCSQVLSCLCCEIVAVILLRELDKSSGERTVTVMLCDTLHRRYEGRI